MANSTMQNRQMVAYSTLESHFNPTYWQGLCVERDRHTTLMESEAKMGLFTHCLILWVHYHWADMEEFVKSYEATLSTVLALKTADIKSTPVLSTKIKGCIWKATDVSALHKYDTVVHSVDALYRRQTYFLLRVCLHFRSVLFNYDVLFHKPLIFVSSGICNH